MKKRLILPFLINIFLLLFSLSAKAEYDYAEISDNTSIEEDFSILGMDISNYFKPKYTYQKWYVVGMAESYIEEENRIQTYFYLYNPTRYGEGSDYMSTVGNFELTYKIGKNGKEELCHSSKLDYNVEHCIYKAKGFSYAYTSELEIYITRIKHNNYRNLGIENASSFKATTKHSKTNGFNVELGFNSTLIIDDIEVVGLEIEPDNSIFKYIFGGEFFEDLFKGGVNSSNLQLYFYNFNFPEDIKPDSIEYAYFELKKEFWQKKSRLSGFSWKEVYDKVIETKDLTYELYPKDFTFDIGNRREEINFPRFYLGNRYKDEQFGDLEFKKLDAEKFNRDCSIFLDYNYEAFYKRYEVQVIGNSAQPDTSYRDYSKLKDVELLELWYCKDGILYKCQIVSNPTDSKPVKVKPQSFWDKLKEFLIKFADWILKTLHIKARVPEGGKIALSIVVLLVMCRVLLFVIKKALS